MSRAARELYAPLTGDDLPVLDHDRITVAEAHPRPAPGPDRDRLVELSQAQAIKAETQMLDVLNGWLERFQAKVAATLNGPRARRGTKWWADSNSAEHKALPVAVETKTRSLDAPYIAPEKLIDEAHKAVRPVALRIALDAGADVAERLGVLPADREGGGMFAVDQLAVQNAVDQAVARILGTIEGHVIEVRKEILRADSSAESLDEVLDLIEQAHRRGGNWIRMSGRTLANALRNEAALRTATMLGVTYMQWLSKRDDRVRHTHRVADGTVRRIDDEFQVGAWFLRFPGDPKDLPASWPEIAGCRCGLLFQPPDKKTADAVRRLNEQRAGEKPAAEVRRLLAAAALAPEVPVPDGAPPAGWAAEVELNEPLVAYRALDDLVSAIPGQWIAYPAALAFALAAPAAFSAAQPVLAVLLPAGQTVTVVGGSIVLPPGQSLEVVGVTDEAVQVRIP